ncbi:TPA: hypothetical protein LVL13_005611 [Klebsiella oxytoca]|nr:hypothetical protein [Klebsiella oxytoca]
MVRFLSIRACRHVCKSGRVSAILKVFALPQWHARPAAYGGVCTQTGVLKLVEADPFF